MSNESTLDRGAPSSTMDEETTRSASPLREGSLERLQKIGGERLVGQLIEIFRASGGGHVDRMREAAVRGDGQVVARAAHALISTAGNVGAERLQALATELARNSDDEAAAFPERVAELAGEFERVRDWLERQ